MVSSGSHADPPRSRVVAVSGEIDRPVQPKLDVLPFEECSLQPGRELAQTVRGASSGSVHHPVPWHIVWADVHRPAYGPRRDRVSEQRRNLTVRHDPSGGDRANDRPDGLPDASRSPARHAPASAGHARRRGAGDARAAQRLILSRCEASSVRPRSAAVNPADGPGPAAGRTPVPPTPSERADAPSPRGLVPDDGARARRETEEARRG